jgi:hypothetical protein
MDLASQPPTGNNDTRRGNSDWTSKVGGSAIPITTWMKTLSDLRRTGINAVRCTLERICNNSTTGKKCLR